MEIGRLLLPQGRFLVHPFTAWQHLWKIAPVREATTEQMEIIADVGSAQMAQSPPYNTKYCKLAHHVAAQALLSATPAFI